MALLSSAALAQAPEAPPTPNTDLTKLGYIKGNTTAKDIFRTEIITKLQSTPAVANKKQ